ncbi:MAG: hypothetical protein A4E48_00134 [Methanosaeta sp. PtaU1.Bin060]|nr:MAG: hypothetical protein A4E48_00134 [Methanosaeta sp. PtaU1.Bin060]
MQPGCFSICSEAMGGVQHIDEPVLRESWSSMIVKRLVIDDLEKTFSLWEASPHWSCHIRSENGEAVGRIGLAAFWRCSRLHAADEDRDLWRLELAVFPQNPFVHPKALARALEASGCAADDSEEKKILALTSYYPGVLIDPRSVRGTSDRLPEPERLLFKTLNEAKAYIARKTPALEALFGAVGDYLEEAQGSAGATGWDVMAEMCLGDDGWRR